MTPDPTERPEVCPTCGGGVIGPDPVNEGVILTWRNVGASRESFTDRPCRDRWHDDSPTPAPDPATPEEEKDG